MSVAATRIELRPSQRLAGRDLRDFAAREAYVRAAHLRSVHRTWGVAYGLRVWAASDEGEVGVSQGLAYDCHGRAILVPDPVRVRPPTEAKGIDVAMFDFAVSYDECPPARCEGHAWPERGGFSWHLAGPVSFAGAQPPLAPSIRLGEHVPLARVMVSGETVAGADNSIRRGARTGGARLKVARAAPGAGGGLSAFTPLRWSLAVDTSEAGFRRTPAYFARLELKAGVSDAAAAALRGIAGPFPSVVAPTATSFVLNVHFGRLGFISPVISGLFDVVWVGVELPAPCPVPIDPGEALAPPGYPFEEGDPHAARA